MNQQGSQILQIRAICRQNMHLLWVQTSQSCSVPHILCKHKHQYSCTTTGHAENGTILVKNVLSPSKSRVVKALTWTHRKSQLASCHITKNKDKACETGNVKLHEAAL